MQKVSLISVLAILALVGVFNTPAAAAQSKACSLVLDVSTLDENGEAKTVKNVRAFVVRRNTRRRIPARLVAGSPQFPGLRTGDYRLTILKRGFRNTTQNVDFSCSELNSKIEVEVSLEPTGGFSESARQGLPPVRRDAITVLGTAPPVAEPGQSDGAAKNGPAVPPPAHSLSGGVLNGKAIELPKPVYPAIARQAHASGTVVVQVLIDETGQVTEAQAISGHPLLQAVSVAAARGARFSPTKLMGQPVKVRGVITYNFVAQ